MVLVKEEGVFHAAPNSPGLIRNYLPTNPFETILKQELKKYCNAWHSFRNEKSQ